MEIEVRMVRVLNESGPQFKGLNIRWGLLVYKAHIFEKLMEDHFSPQYSQNLAVTSIKKI